METISKRAKIIIWSSAALFFAVIIIFDIAPTGHATYSAALDANKGGFFVSKITPADRVSAGQGDIDIIGDPAYFTLTALRPFDKAKVTIEYESTDVPVIEVGQLVDSRVWRYGLKPLDNSYIDSLVAGGWPVVEDGGLTLIERTKKYDTIQSFLDNPPQRDRIALYDFPSADIAGDYLIPGYSATSSTISWPMSLRGNFQFYVYIQDEPLDFSFDFETLNKNKDDDPIDVYLYYADKMIDSRHIDGQKEPNDWGRPESRGHIDLATGGLPEGVYKIEVKGNDDVITENIKTRQTHVVFANRIWVNTFKGKTLKLWSDSSVYNLLTTNPGSLGDIAVGEKKLAIGATYKQFSLSTDAKLREIVLPAQDVAIAGNGVFSLSRETFFDPGWKSVGQGFDPSTVDYVLARYDLPQMGKDGGKMASAEFDLTKAYSERQESVLPVIHSITKKYSFMISAPGLRADDERQDKVKIKSIKIELSGPNIFQILGRLVRKVF